MALINPGGTFTFGAGISDQPEKPPRRAFDSPRRLLAAIAPDPTAHWPGELEPTNLDLAGLTPKHKMKIGNWEYEAYVEDDAITVHCFMPEVPDLRFEWTGLCGGDSGNGARSRFIICPDHSGDHQMHALYFDGGMGSLSEVVLSSGGDWETGGMCGALICLGQVLAIEGWAEKR